MHTVAIGEAQASERGKLSMSEEEIARLPEHLQEVLESASFRASQRSGQFLKYIVEQTLAGHLESLKERVIGMELFGRSSTYDTGEDAIVRVTASDVRKRLHQHYDKYGAASEFHIGLPPGSYIPVITHREPLPASTNGSNHNGNGDHSVDQTETALEPGTEIVPLETVHPLDSAIPNSISESQPARSKDLRYLIPATVILLLIFAVSGMIAWNRYSLVQETPRTSLLWSAFFRSPHPTQVIMSDPNLAEIEGFTGYQLSASDYANHNYIPDSVKLTPEVEYFCRVILRGDKVAAVDAPIALYIGQMALAASRVLNVHAARSIRVEDLASDNNFVFLGSPRTNPWSLLFSDQLDFRFDLDQKTKTEFFRNVHPRPNEASTYLPTAPGWATGRSFATVALVKNRDQIGDVLLIAGETGEGTDAAGRLLADETRLNATLKSCGVSGFGSVQHWQLLLQLNAMAGAPSNVDVVACHLLDHPQGQ